MKEMWSTKDKHDKWSLYGRNGASSEAETKTLAAKIERNKFITERTRKSGIYKIIYDLTIFFQFNNIMPCRRKYETIDDEFIHT